MSGLTHLAIESSCTVRVTDPRSQISGSNSVPTARNTIFTPTVTLPDVQSVGSSFSGTPSPSCPGRLERISSSPDPDVTPVGPFHRTCVSTWK